MRTEARERYSRQILFAGIGERGQEKLLRSHAAIVGCGALGSLQAEGLARAGVGRLSIIDRDYVEAGNLQRQFLFDETDAAQSLPKAAAAERRLKQINSTVRIDGIVADVNPGNIGELFAEIDLILDGTDNFETRFLINDYAVRHGVPWIYGAAVGSYGISMPIIPVRTACFRCIYPEPPPHPQPTCETAGILSPATGMVASWQLGSALKILSGNSINLTARITSLDVWEGWVRQIEQPHRDPECPCCAKRDFSYLSAERQAPVSLCGRNAVQIHERSKPLDLRELNRRLAPLGQVRVNEFALRFFPAPYEMTVFPDGRAIVKGTTDIGVARSLYARYVGS